MAEHGAIHVRRAYCNAETAVKHQSLFKRLSVRPMVNLSAGKNSTDIALAVDAMDLVIAERPEIVVLVSSDSDFAPLVIRLREKGCRVCGIGQQGKTGDETIGRLRRVHRPAAPGRRPRSSRPPSAPARAPRRAPRRPQPAPRSAAACLPEDVLRILDAVPETAQSAQRMELNQAAEALRAAKLLGRSGSSLKLFKKHPELFALTPDNAAQQGPVPGAAGEVSVDALAGEARTCWTRAGPGSRPGATVEQYGWRRQLAGASAAARGAERCMRADRRCDLPAAGTAPGDGLRSSTSSQTARCPTATTCTTSSTAWCWLAVSACQAAAQRTAGRRDRARGHRRRARPGARCAHAVRRERRAARCTARAVGGPAGARLASGSSSTCDRLGAGPPRRIRPCAAGKAGRRLARHITAHVWRRRCAGRLHGRRWTRWLAGAAHGRHAGGEALHAAAGDGRSGLVRRKTRTFPFMMTPLVFRPAGRQNSTTTRSDCESTPP